MHRALGMSGNAIVTAEVDAYSDSDIAMWDRADAFEQAERV